MIFYRTCPTVRRTFANTACLHEDVSVCVRNLVQGHSSENHQTSHKCCSWREDEPYWFSRSRVKGQGHYGLLTKIVVNIRGLSIHQRIIKPSTGWTLLIFKVKAQDNFWLLPKILVNKIEETTLIRESSNLPLMFPMESGCSLLIFKVKVTIDCLNILWTRQKTQHSSENHQNFHKCFPWIGRTLLIFKVKGHYWLLFKNLVLRGDATLVLPCCEDELRV